MAANRTAIVQVTECIDALAAVRDELVARLEDAAGAPQANLNSRSAAP